MGSPTWTFAERSPGRRAQTAPLRATERGKPNRDSELGATRLKVSDWWGQTPMFYWLRPFLWSCTWSATFTFWVAWRSIIDRRSLQQFDAVHWPGSSQWRREPSRTEEKPSLKNSFTIYVIMLWGPVFHSLRLSLRCADTHANTSG